MINVFLAIDSKKHDNSKIPLRDVCTKFQPFGEYNKNGYTS